MGPWDLSAQLDPRDLSALLCPSLLFRWLPPGRWDLSAQLRPWNLSGQLHPWDLSALWGPWDLSALTDGSSSYSIGFRILSRCLSYRKYYLPFMFNSSFIIIEEYICEIYIFIISIFSG